MVKKTPKKIGGRGEINYPALGMGVETVDKEKNGAEKKDKKEKNIFSGFLGKFFKKHRVNFQFSKSNFQLTIIK